MKKRLLQLLCAVAMLAVAILICIIFQDDSYKQPVGVKEIRGKLSTVEADTHPQAGIPAELKADDEPKKQDTPQTIALKKTEEKQDVAVEKQPEAKAVEKKENAPAAIPAPPEKKADAALPKSLLNDTPPAVQSPKALEESPAPKNEKVVENVGQNAQNNVSAEETPDVLEKVVTQANFVLSGKLIKLVLRGNSPMVGHYYLLKNPDRVVLDIGGNWKIKMPKVPSNRLIQSVRVGKHQDKTRIVFDMKTRGKVALIPINRNSLELRIQ